jgi:hypothetical protein
MSSDNGKPSINALSLEILSALGGTGEDAGPPLILSGPDLGGFFLAVLQEA